MSAPRRLGRALPLVAALALPACVATRQDLAVLQNDLRVMRTESAMADSVHRAELARVSAVVRILQDSVLTLTRSQTKFQGDVLGYLHTTNQQLLQIQELTGQSQRRLQELRAEMEERAQAAPPAASPDPVAGAPAVTGAAPAPGAPGPNQLFQLAMGQLRSGATGTARSGFQELLRQYPQSDLAGDAQYQIAEALRSEGKGASADSAYAIVYTKYPQAARAPSALYKHGISLQAAGKVSQARVLFDRVVKDYPSSDEAMLARERLRTQR